MEYNQIVEGIFLDRPNRFIANVLIGDMVEAVHVRNTGRCKELLIVGARVNLEKAINTNRKTKYSLISVYKGSRLINIDSQIPNIVVAEAICQNRLPLFGEIRQLTREYTYGNSRLDFMLETSDDQKWLIEVKGVTLERDELALFPDAPTLRGTKHLLELTKAKRENFQSAVIFLIQMDEISQFAPNHLMDEAFSQSLQVAKEQNVTILAYNSHVTSKTILLNQPIEIIL